jgi:hypothetical protein
VFVTFGDALLMLFEVADREDERFQSAAARWHARFTLAAGLTLQESGLVLNMLGDMRGAHRIVLRRRLIGQVDRAGLAAREIT